MIAAGLTLLAVGAADLLRAFVAPVRRWIGLLIGAVVLIVFGVLSDSLVAALGAIIVAALWAWLSPIGARARAGFWPVVVLGALCAILVAVVPPRSDAGVIGAVWALPTPFGVVSLDAMVLVLGTVVFLMESANVVVRTALQQEDVQVARTPFDATSVTGVEVSAPPAGLAPDHSTTDAATPAAGSATPAEASVTPDEASVTPDEVSEAPSAPSVAEAVPIAAEPSLKGGRLIGPLERILVFALTLAVMYPLLAAVLAAKGIVRFPEISRDSAAGNRAEYFLIGSLVSWVIALAGAFLVWWAFATP
ncbi:hypothetical protein G5T42_00050 [Microbacterium sp. 4R-513]|uniref:hypothetical protein n=1 Tax=Microbacterium sp. 4R-513 TaxID=2567934 RepID=UPI0013E1356B|nr:hypothetical protein [Microbacterium sp. 4R-513]QIG38074.1 hypothetical protein G5T42_00050 [Microbacterium sp. 4R-513]